MMQRDDGPRAPRPSGAAIVLVLVGALFAGQACARDQDVGHQGVLVGGPCLSERDCVDRCLDGGRYPSGTCSVECEDDTDCPDGTWCIDYEGGVCLLACDREEDCRNAYECEGRDRKGTPGEALACRDG